MLNLAKGNFMLIALLCATVTFFSCKNDEKTVDCDTFEWGYEGEGMPENWSKCYSECGGSSQSPINIVDAEVNSALSALSMNYSPASLYVKNTGHGIKLNYDNGSTLTVDGKEFKLLQFHFHTGSEHTVAGNQYPMEVHLVHQNQNDGTLAVVGVFFKEGAENALLSKFVDNLPAEVDGTVKSDTQINVSEFLPSSANYFTYSGSLTTPGCDEIVTWLVMEENIEASAAQIEKLDKIGHNNFRPVQALNGRTLSKFKAN